MPRANHCIFCGNDLQGTRSREHIFPKWLQEHLHLQRRELHHVLYTSDGQPTPTRRDHCFNSLVSGRVCSTCNSGWLAQLEGQAKPHLVPLLDGTYTGAMPATISGLVATWMFKTALTLDSVSQRTPKLVSKAHYDFLYQNKTVPLDVAIGMAHLINDELNWIQGGCGYAPVHQHTDGLRAYLRGTYRICLGVGHLAWRVDYWPPWPQDLGAAVRLHDHYEASIAYPWLRGARQVSWPPPDTINSVQEFYESSWLRPII